MRVSLNWLSEYVDHSSLTPKEISELTSIRGIEAEAVEGLAEATNCVVGYVESKEKHPEADKLNVCQVNVGEETLQIVCGAKNVDAGQKVIVALPGAVLPGNFKIKQSKLRGVESNGMICSLQELGIDSKYVADEFKDGIMVLDADAPVGTDAVEYLELNDTIIEYGLTPNRNDCLSMLGMAYELGAVMDKPVSLPKFEVTETEELTSDYITLDIDTEVCPQYQTRLVKNVVIKESPNFIKSRLIAAGIRPISNVVDITNYVLLEYGQPLHAFDYDELGNHIKVRLSEPNEEIITLDDINRELDNDIMITDGTKGVCIGGVMGGQNTEVSDKTVNVLLESAIFSPGHIRKTSKRLELRSEASQRFEKGVDPNRTIAALNRAAYLLEKYASGEVTKGIVGVDVVDKTEKVIKVEKSFISARLGVELGDNEILDIFARLGIKAEIKDDTLTTSIPTRRMDLTIKEDLVEEVGRIYGYENIPAVLPTLPVKAGKYYPNKKQENDIKKFMLRLGLNQVVTYELEHEDAFGKFTLDSVSPIKLALPMSEEHSTLRYSLLPSLYECYLYNAKRSTKDVQLFEVSRSSYMVGEERTSKLFLSGILAGTYQANKWQQINNKVDFYTVKGLVESLFEYLRLSNRVTFVVPENLPSEYHPTRTAEVLLDRKSIGYVGQIHPSIEKNEVYVFELNLDSVINTKVRPVKFQQIVKYPSISKDMAFVVNNSVMAEDVITVIKKANGRILKSVSVFDVYENLAPGKKSLAFNLVYEDQNKTLTDEEVMEQFKKAITEVESKLDAKLR